VPHRGLTTLGAFVTTLGLITGCSDGNATPGARDRSNRPRPTTELRSFREAGDPDNTRIRAILDFRAPALGGGTIRGADYAPWGVAFWFWAPW
jgi:hypothetical protein